MDVSPATKPVSTEKMTGQNAAPKAIMKSATPITQINAAVDIDLMSTTASMPSDVMKQLAGLAIKLDEMNITEKKKVELAHKNGLEKAKPTVGSGAKKSKAAKPMHNAVEKTTPSNNSVAPKEETGPSKPVKHSASSHPVVASTVIKGSNGKSSPINAKTGKKKQSKDADHLPNESVLPLLQKPPPDDWKLSLTAEQLTAHIDCAEAPMIPRFSSSCPPPDATANPSDLMRLSAAIDMRKKTTAILATMKDVEKVKLTNSPVPLKQFSAKKKRKPTGPRPIGCIAPPQIEGPYPVLYQVILKQHSDNGGPGGFILEAKDAALFLADRMDLRLVSIDDDAENVMTSRRGGLSWIGIGDLVWVYEFNTTPEARDPEHYKSTLGKSRRLQNGCQRDTTVFWRVVSYAPIEPAVKPVLGLIMGEKEQGCLDGMVRVALPGSKDEVLVPAAQCDVKRKPEGVFVIANVREKMAEEIFMSAASVNESAKQKIEKMMELVGKASEEAWRRSVDVVRPLLSVEALSCEYEKWIEDRLNGGFRGFARDEKIALKRMDDLSRAACAGCAVANLMDEDKRWRSVALHDISVSDHFINMRVHMKGFVAECGWTVRRQALLRLPGLGRPRYFTVTASDLDTKARVLSLQLNICCDGWKKNETDAFKVKDGVKQPLMAGLKLAPLPDAVDPIFKIIANQELGRLPKKSTAVEIMRAIYSETTEVAIDSESPGYASVSPSQAIANGNLIKLRPEQRAAIDAAVSEEPILMIQAAFGTGKTTTSSIIAAEAVTKHKRFIAVTATTNAAVAQFCHSLASLSFYDIRLLRIVSPEGSQDHPTPFDLDTVMSQLISTHGHKMKQAEKNLVAMYVESKELMKSLANGVAMLPNLTVSQQEKYVEAKKIVEKTIGRAMEIMLRLRPPHVIFATISSLLNRPTMINKFGSEEVQVSAILTKWKHKLTILCDEASQVPEPALIALLHNFPQARMRFIGDHRQLAPYTMADRTSLAARAGARGVSVVLAHAARVPKVALVETFRCHPEITSLPSDLFYEGRLVSLATPEQRQEISRIIAFPNPAVPVAFIDIAGAEVKLPSQSYANMEEAAFARQLVSRLLKGGIAADQIFVISFYKEQQKEMTRQLADTGVVSTTVDSVQGREATVTILLTTRTKPNLCGTFLDEATRMNVALSRARSGLFVLGALPALKNLKNWGRLVKWTEKRKAVIKAEAAAKAFYLKS